VDGSVFNFEIVYYYINSIRYFIAVLAFLTGSWMLVTMISLLIKRGEIMQFSGPAALVMQTEYSYGFILRRFIVGFYLIKFAAIIGLVGSDIVGEEYAYGLAEFDKTKPSHLMLAKLLFDLFRTYGALTLLRVGWDASKNQDPFTQQGKSPWASLLLKTLGGFAMIFMTDIIDSIWKISSLNVFGFVADMATRM
jgi:hypothetical protein